MNTDIFMHKSILQILQIQLEASEPKCVNPDDINMGLTHLDSEASNYDIIL